MDWVIVVALVFAFLGVVALFTVFREETPLPPGGAGADAGDADAAVRGGDEPEQAVEPEAVREQDARREQRLAERRGARGSATPKTYAAGGDDGKAPRKRGKKYMRKQAVKEAKRRAREAREAEQAKIAAAKAEADALLAEQQAREEEEAAAAAAAAAAEEAARAKAEEEAYQALVGEFEVQAEGSVLQDLAADGQDIIDAFVSYVKRNKVVEIDALAGKFHLRPVDAVERIRSLEADGRLTGVFDDRGKYIYITAKELAAIARHVNLQGRITVDEVAAVASSIIQVDKKRKKRKKKKSKTDVAAASADA